MERHDDDGFVLIVLMTLLVPMILVVGAFSTAMLGKSNELRTELDRERALLAAESGIDEAIFHGQTGALTKTSPAWSRSLGNGASFEVTPTYLGADGQDNDGDGIVDVPLDPDEDVFQVVVVGSYRGWSRRVAAYLGPVPLLPTITTAIGVQNPSLDITLNGSSQISGNDTTMAGVATGSSVAGLSIAPPGTTADLAAQLTGGEELRVVGAGGSPSLGTTGTYDLNDIVDVLQNVADIVLTSNRYSSYNFGTGVPSDPHIAFRSGNVKFAGNSQGAGIMVVTGDLTVTGTFRFDGVVIVLGDILNASGTMDICGAILQGPSASELRCGGTADIVYSSDAIALANSISGRYVAFNGWQELSQ